MHDVPENLLYSKDHEWIEIDGDIGTIGIPTMPRRSSPM